MFKHVDLNENMELSEMKFYWLIILSYLNHFFFISTSWALGLLTTDIEPADITELHEVCQILTIVLDIHPNKVFHLFTFEEPVLLKP